MRNQNNKENMGSVTKPGFAGTNPQRVKQDIQKDVSQGQGSMTSREAGGMQD